MAWTRAGSDSPWVHNRQENLPFGRFLGCGRRSDVFVCRVKRDKAKTASRGREIFPSGKILVTTERCYTFSMPNENISPRVDELEKKIDAIYVSVEKTRKYILTTMIITIIVVVLPVLGLFFALPSFMGTYNQLNSALEDGY